MSKFYKINNYSSVYPVSPVSSAEEYSLIPTADMTSLIKLNDTIKEEVRRQKEEIKIKKEEYEIQKQYYCKLAYNVIKEYFINKWSINNSEFVKILKDYEINRQMNDSSKYLKIEFRIKFQYINHSFNYDGKENIFAYQYITCKGGVKSVSINNRPLYVNIEDQQIYGINLDKLTKEERKKIRIYYDYNQENNDIFKKMFREIYDNIVKDWRLCGFKLKYSQGIFFNTNPCITFIPM